MNLVQTYIRPYAHICTHHNERMEDGEYVAHQLANGKPTTLENTIELIVLCNSNCDVMRQVTGIRTEEGHCHCPSTACHVMPDRGPVGSANIVREKLTCY